MLQNWLRYSHGQEQITSDQFIRQICWYLGAVQSQNQLNQQSLSVLYLIIEINLNPATYLTTSIILLGNTTYIWPGRQSIQRGYVYPPWITC